VPVQMGTWMGGSMRKVGLLVVVASHDDPATSWPGHPWEEWWTVGGGKEGDSP
jgi:hypothetical protein